MMKRTAMMALAAGMMSASSPAVTVLTETFTKTDEDPFNGTADLTWAGNLADLEIVSNQVVQRDLTVGESNYVANVSTIDSLAAGESYRWEGTIGSGTGQSMNVNGSNWGGIILTSDSSDAAVLSAGGAVNAIRAVWLGGGTQATDFLALQQSTSTTTGWSPVGTISSLAQLNINTSPTFTVTLNSVGVFVATTDNGLSATWDAGGAVALGDYSGFVTSSAGTRIVYADDFKLEVIPEPATGGLALLGLCALAFRRRVRGA